MGIGAAVAGGCNIGHGITGISVLALSSVTATAFTMLGVWAMTWLIYASARKTVAGVSEAIPGKT